MNTIRDLMTVDVVTVKSDAILSEVISLMSDKNISCVVILKNDRPEGIITERDLLRKVLYKKTDPKNLKASDIMSSPVISIHPDIEFGDALSIMETNHLRRLIVVEDDILAGLITNTDIVAKTKSINTYNKKLMFYQNIQSYVIFIFFIFIVLYFVIKFLL